MTMSRNTDKSNLAELFRQPCTSIQTTGTQEGVILKFRSFYLKIYDDNREDGYIVEGYRYFHNSPLFCDKVPVTQMRSYAAKF